MRIVSIFSFLFFLLSGVAFALTPSARIDQLVEKAHLEHEVEAYPRISDEVFVRRIYLDVIGRVPSIHETRAFLKSEDAEKRSALIDELLASEGYVLHHYNYWADLLRAKTILSGAGQSVATGHAYMRWIKEALRENKPYDEMVTELLTAEGQSWKNGAVGFYIRDYGMPLDQMAVTTQVFLGTQVVCAQCHDHPFDSWTQLDYYHLAAFSHNTFTTNGHASATEAGKLFKERRKKYPEFDELEVRRAFNEILKPVRFNNVYHNPNRMARLPHDYQYENAKPKDKVSPKIPELIGDPAALGAVKKGERPIEAYARWMTSPENPRFTKVIVNRLWAKAMGRGVIEPLDEFTEHTEASNPKLMAYLEKLMIETDYDMRAFLSAIYKSDAYQRESHGEDILLGLPYYFPGPVLRRMSAEQIWDSVLTLVRPNPDLPSADLKLQGDRQLAMVESVANSVYDQSPQQLLDGALQIAKVQKELSAASNANSARLQEARENDDEKAIRECNEEAGRLRRALVTKIEEIVYRRGFEDKLELVSMAPKKAKKEAESVDEDFVRQLRGILSEADVDMSDSANPMREYLQTYDLEQKAKLKEQASEARHADRRALGLDSKNKKLVDEHAKFFSMISRVGRAAETRSPAPPGHFLREFGQSDREVVANSSDDASVTQALSLMNNGILLPAITNQFSALGREVTKAKGPHHAIDTIYFALLSRKATQTEKELLLPLYKGKGEEALQEGATQTVWALLNTRQFMFVE